MTEADQPPPQARKFKLTWQQVALSLLSLGLALFLMVVVVPRAAGADWSDAIDLLSHISVWNVVVMTAFWAVGLWCYTFVYTGSLPGLSHSKALALNLTGSFISNLLPFGGAAGVATTYGLTYAWGFSGIATSLMVLASGLANILIRIVLPLVGVVCLLASGMQLPDTAQNVLIATLITLIIAATLILAVLLSAGVAAAIGAAIDWFLIGLTKMFRGGPPGFSVRVQAVELQMHSRQVLFHRWPAISFGMIAYYASETILFGIGLHALGATVSWPQIIAAFALSRVLTAVVVTPSGTGISEAGTASLLVLFGCPPAQAAAGVLILYIYTYLIELPAGAIGWGWVFLMRKQWFKRRPLQKYRAELGK